MNKFLIGILVTVVLGLVGWYFIYSRNYYNEYKNSYQLQIDSLNVNIDSIKQLREVDKIKIDSLSIIATNFKVRLDISKSNYNKINQKYEKIRLDLNSYSTDQSIEFFAEQVSEEAGY